MVSCEDTTYIYTCRPGALDWAADAPAPTDWAAEPATGGWGAEPTASGWD